MDEGAHIAGTGVGATSPGRPGWYLRRLRAMSPAEMGWRGSRLVASRARVLLHSSGHGVSVPADLREWQVVLNRFRSSVDRPVVLDRPGARRIAERYPAAVADLVAQAEKALLPEVTYFGHPSVRLGSPVDWSHDPLADVRWPRGPARRVDHRTFPGDPKWIWELNRLQHLCWLSEAWLFTGREELARGALDQLDSWMTQNPPGHGIGWKGAFEAGVRAVSVALALQGLRDAPSLDLPLFRRAVEMLAWSADYCWRERSRFSSANNHLVGEMTGLFTVAALLPDLAQAPRWERRALRTLTAEAERQILPDGAGAEQAVGYQVFTAELLGVVIALLRARGDVPPEPIVAAVDRSATYLASLVDGSEPPPRYGDDDEGFALRLDVEPAPVLRRHLAVATTLTGNGVAARNAEATLTSAWLAEIPGMPAPRAAPDQPVPSRYAADGGLVLLRTPRRRIIMDVGPLGYLSIAAHGHADALSVALAASGRELVGDPGTGSYYAHPDWRRVHRGTRTHATLAVDDLDQSEAGGPFLWTRHAAVRVRSVDLERGIVDAEHDGYRRLEAPVTHRRWLVAPPEWPGVLVLDLIQGEGEHHVRTSWPLHPFLCARSVPGGYDAFEDGVPRLLLRCAAATTDASAVPEVEAERGDTETNRGWWSDRLESRVPAWVVSASWHGPVPVALATVLVTEPEHGIADVGLRWDEERLIASWSTGGDAYEVVADPRAGTVVTWTSSR